MNEHQDTTATSDTKPDPILQWWQQQWLSGAQPLARMQLAWMMSMVDAMQFEAQYLHTLAESGQRMARSFAGGKPPSGPEMQTHYRKLMEEITKAHMTRLQRVSQLTDDFRDRIWEEL